jgi:hypothetical protein
MTDKTIIMTEREARALIKAVEYGCGRSFPEDGREMS